jgi:hypothetical protein
MKISWQKLSDFEIRINLNGFSIGKVEYQPGSRSWLVKPNFSFSGKKQAVLYQKFDSSYEAGKVLAKLYQSENKRWDHNYYEQEDTDTLELDMRDMWKNLKP